MAGHDGGPAFPQHLIETSNGALQASYDAPDGAGMTLRDWFAGQALALGGEWFHNCAADDMADIAKVAYTMSNAMLVARMKAT